MVMVLAPATKGIAWLKAPEVTEEPLTLIDAQLTAEVGVTEMDEAAYGTLAE